MFLMIYEYRCSLRAFIAATAIGISAMAGVEIYILLRFGVAPAGQAGPFVCSIPSFILFFIMSKDRGPKFIFTFCLMDTVSYWVLVVTGLFDHFVGGGGVVLLILRILAFPFLDYAIWKWFRRPYLELVHNIERGWWLFSFITILCYAILILMSVYPVILYDRPGEIPVATLITIFIPVSYVAIFTVLRQQQTAALEKERQTLLQAQISMMERRAEETRSAEERIRIERHDLRHRLETVAALVEKEQRAEALDYLDSARAALDEAVPTRYCSNAVLDAILTLYFERARARGIEVRANLDIPDELPVDASELSTVFANALENALRACSGLPPEKQKIVCTGVTDPGLIFEIANPYEGEVLFDPNGLPISPREGHGIGTRSIMAFAEKNNAICRFRAEDGWFKVQVAL